MQTDVQQTLHHNNNLPDEYMENLTSFIDRIENFTGGYPENSKERFESLCRIIDGKRVFDRIQRDYTLKDEYRFNLARRIRENNRIPNEIVDLIQSLKRWVEAMFGVIRNYTNKRDFQ